MLTTDCDFSNPNVYSLSTLDILICFSSSFAFDIALLILLYTNELIIVNVKNSILELSKLLLKVRKIKKSKNLNRGCLDKLIKLSALKTENKCNYNVLNLANYFRILQKSSNNGFVTCKGVKDARRESQGMFVCKLVE